VSNFNIHHLQQLKLARPNHIPAGKLEIVDHSLYFKHYQPCINDLAL